VESTIDTHNDKVRPVSNADPVTSAIAAAFRQARLRRAPLPDFPGIVPTHLAQSYAIQDAAIAAWPGKLCGWKVGRILEPAESLHGVNRLIGPIFQEACWQAEEDRPIAAIVGGFCAVEAEYVFKLAKPSPSDPDAITPALALSLVDTLYTGVEIAGSPLATINELGPTVVVSDFGNNAALILGQEVNDWRERLETFQASMRIDGELVGSGQVSTFPDGILGALVFALRLAAQRRRPMGAGFLVSTGAVSGVHDFLPGQSAVADFGPDGKIACHCIAANPVVL
jgi:2-keto-4-pentenoate hydratase